MNKVNRADCSLCDFFKDDEMQCEIYCEKDLTPDMCKDEKSYENYEKWCDANIISSLE